MEYVRAAQSVAIVGAGGAAALETGEVIRLLSSGSRVAFEAAQGDSKDGEMEIGGRMIANSVSW